MEFDFDSKGNVNEIYIGLNIGNKQNYCLMGAKIGMNMRTANDAIIKKGAELRRWSTSGYRVYKTNKGGCVYMDYWANEEKVSGLSLSSTYSWWF